MSSQPRAEAGAPRVRAETIPATGSVVGVAVTTTSGEYRQRILEAFAAVLRDKGLARAQITDICRVARISKRTFYECFATKEAAFTELIADASEATFAAVAAAASADLPWADLVARAVGTYLAGLGDEPVMAAAISTEMAGLGDGGAAARHQAVDRYAGLLVAASSAPARAAEGVVALDADTALLVAGGIAELVDRALSAGRHPAELGATITGALLAITSPHRR